MELYIHIPFCKQKCRYCDFASWAGITDRMDSYVELLLEEAKQQNALMEGAAETVYIGGGTPSLLPSSLLFRLIRSLRDIWGISPDAEFTMEANPGTVTEEWLNAARSCGVNRLSLGVQACQDHLLAMLGRIHRFREAEETVGLARKAGFSNLSIDLMFGLPGQTEQDWRETLEAAISLNPEHISAYGLIPEEGTPLEKDLRAGRLMLPDPAEERSMYTAAREALRGKGYFPYEVSNFSKPGYECRHNLGYWRQIPYLGLGVSAASMVRRKKEAAGIRYTRLTNPRNYTDYESMIRSGKPAREEIMVSVPEARFETLMLGLRLYEGIGEEEFLRLHGISLEEYRGPVLHSLETDGLLCHRDGRWFLTDRGMDIQNSVLVELMD